MSGATRVTGKGNAFGKALTEVRAKGANRCERVTGKLFDIVSEYFDRKGHYIRWYVRFFFRI